VLLALCVSGVLSWYSFRALPRTLARSNFYMFLISVAYLDLSGPLAYFYTGRHGCIQDAPHFSYSYYLAVSNFVGSVGGALGAVLFQSMQKWSFRSAFVVTTCAQVIASLFDLLIIQRWNMAIGMTDAAAYLFGDAACQNMAAMLAMMPCAVLTARLCPRGAEATVYAILAGFQNFGMSISSVLGARLCDAFGVVASQEGPCDFGNLTKLVILAHVVAPMACVPLTFWLVPSARIDDESAFVEASQPPSFRSPASSSPASSPPSSPKLGWSEAHDDDGEYLLMVDDGAGMRKQISG